MDLNKVILVGRVTADPQLKTTPGGQSVTTIGVATNRTWTDKSGAKQEQVEFHNVVIWGRQAEIAGQFLTKGAMVLVEGRLQSRTWTDKNGAQRRTTEIMCERMQLGPRAGSSQGQGFDGSSSSRGASAGGFNRSGSQSASSSSNQGVSSGDLPPMDEVPVINLEEEGDLKPEDIPF